MGPTAAEPKGHVPAPASFGFPVLETTDGGETKVAWLASGLDVRNSTTVSFFSDFAHKILNTYFSS